VISSYCGKIDASVDVPFPDPPPTRQEILDIFNRTEIGQHVYVPGAGEVVRIKSPDGGGLFIQLAILEKANTEQGGPQNFDPQAVWDKAVGQK
jgi:hypothetical protein